MFALTETLKTKILKELQVLSTLTCSGGQESIEELTQEIERLPRVPSSIKIPRCDDPFCRCVDC